MKDSNRNNNFGTLHLLAAFFVLYGHQCVLLGENVPMIFGSQIQAVGVKMIFLISGFLIMKSLSMQEGSIWKICSVYVTKRIGRLYPELIACVCGIALIIGPLFTNISLVEYFNQYRWAIKEYIINNLLLKPSYYLPGMFEANPYAGAVNGSLWTMPVEVFAYVIFLIFFIGMYKFKISKHFYGIFTFGISILFLVKFIAYPSARWVLYGTDWASALNVLPYMFVGAVCYLYDIKKYLNVQWAMFIFIAVGSILFKTEFVRETVCLLLLPYVVFALGMADEQGLRLRFLKGEYAYGMYLWGFVIQQCLIQKCYVEHTFIHSKDIMAIMSAIIAYVLAALSYHLIYIPISKWNKRLIVLLQEKL